MLLSWKITIVSGTVTATVLHAGEVWVFLPDRRALQGKLLGVSVFDLHSACYVMVVVSLVSHLTVPAETHRAGGGRMWRTVCTRTDTFPLKHMPWWHGTSLPTRVPKAMPINLQEVMFCWCFAVSKTRKAAEYLWLPFAGTSWMHLLSVKMCVCTPIPNHSPGITACFISLVILGIPQIAHCLNCLHQYKFVCSRYNPQRHYWTSLLIAGLYLCNSSNEG